jgi:uncharacterized iron-regulated membrane protein
LSARHVLLRVHRYAGAALAAFIVLAGLTGSLLAFHHEIDAWLVPELHRVQAGPARASLDEAAARIEAERPGLVVGYFVMSPDPAASVRVVMNARAAAEAGRLDRKAAGNAEVYLDPYSGRVLGERRWGEVGTTRAHLVPMLYRLHMSLFLEEAGQWITAIVGLVLIAMLVLGTFLALPRLRVLGKALRVRWDSSRARAFFDVHRAAGLALGWLLAVIAFTGMYMNLPPAVTEPVVTAVSSFTERPRTVREPGAPREASWRIGWDEALARARAVEPANALAVFGRVESRGYYHLRFLAPGDIVDAGTRRVFVSGRDGAVLGRFDDLQGTAADLFRIWQFPLHSGQGFGMPGRVAICAAGLLPLLFAFTGLWLWRRRVVLRRAAAAPG